jgi:ADP-heptose:LPS heptosyltransferase
MYLYAEETNDQAEQQWLSQYGMAILANLTIPQTAALVARSGLLVTGNTLLFGLAALFAARAVGVFDAKEHAAYCPAADGCRGVTYEKAPDADTICAVAAAIAELMGVA